MKVLITGGAGFIGTHLTRHLLAQGMEVTVLDNFSPQIHGIERQLAPDLRESVRLYAVSISDSDALGHAMDDQDVVVHLAAETGTGQSMYEVNRYADVNLSGTARLFDLLINQRQRFSRVKKLVVASSRAIYGEGRYRCAQHGLVYPLQRTVERMAAGLFEPTCPSCGFDCAAAPTDEATPCNPSSFYGLTKRVQEEMTLLFARSLGISGFALRYQNVYGPGQSLQNPYTGILAIFSNLARHGQDINVFEDGQESRDFVYIEDVVDATARCLRPEIQGVAAFNVGSGVGTSVLDVAQKVRQFFDSPSRISVTGAFRTGDIRHNVADLSLVKSQVGFEPRWSFNEGLSAFLNWAQNHEGNGNGFARSLDELRSKGLMHG